MNRQHTQTTFSIYTDKVYAWLKMPEKTIGKHTLEGYWYKPDGSLYRRTHVPLNFMTPDAQFAYMWLKVKTEPGGLLGRFGRDDDNIDGVWKLKVFWDGKMVAESKFDFKYVKEED